MYEDGMESRDLRREGETHRAGDPVFAHLCSNHKRAYGQRWLDESCDLCRWRMVNEGGHMCNICSMRDAPPPTEAEAKSVRPGTLTVEQLLAHQEANLAAQVSSAGERSSRG